MTIQTSEFQNSTRSSGPSVSGVVTSPRVLVLLTGNLTGGGAERMVVNLCRSLAQLSCSVHMAFPQSDDWQTFLNWCSKWQVEGWSLAADPSVQVQKAPREGYKEVIGLRNLVRDTHPEVVNLHFCNGWLGLRDIVAVRLAGYRPVCSVHTIDSWENMGKRKRQMTKLASYLVDTIIVNSAGTKDMLLEAGVSQKKIRVVHCGVHEPTVRSSRSDARTRLGLPEDAFVIATASRLVAEKGTAELIDAVAQLHSREKPIHLVIAGDGEELEALKAQGAQLLPGRCHFLGRVEETDDLYASADLFSMPSWFEAFGMVYVEAAFYGLPSVGCATGGVAEVIRDGETGLLVPCKAPEKLASALQALYDDPERRLRLGANAQEYCRQKFTGGVMAKHYLSVLALG